MSPAGLAPPVAVAAMAEPSVPGGVTDGLPPGEAVFAELLREFVATVHAYPLPALALLLVFLGVLAWLTLFHTAAGRRWREEHHIRGAMKRLGARVMRNVTLPDGIGGETTIDYLLLTGDAIRVVGVLRFPGVIFGGMRTDQWTQVLNSRSYKFPNPNDYLQQQVSAVRALVPDTEVHALHLFSDEARFPRGKPPDVLSPAEIRAMTPHPRIREIPKDLRDAWDVLVAAARRA
jgi:hypothetical protein